jgi:hypothetical protein
MDPTIKGMKVYAVIESVMELPRGFNIGTFFDHLRQNKFGGETHVNSNQGGVTNVVTREHISLTMSELDRVLAERSK